MTPDHLLLWTIYDHPSDFPHAFVAREFAISRGDGAVSTGGLIVAPGLDDLRDHFTERGLACLRRRQGDDPVIVEVWL